MKRKLIAILTALAALCISINAYALTGVRFKDVTAADWFYDAVKYVSDNNVMTGTQTDTFSPEQTLTRAMAVTVLSRIYGADLTAVTDSGFTDVDTNRYYAAPVAWAKQTGIVKGVSDTEFEPEKNVTREQVCVMLSNFFDYCSLSTRNTQCESFADEADISAWAKAAVIRMQRGQIVNGKENNKFFPKDNITRAEFAQIIKNTNLANFKTLG